MIVPLGHGSIHVGDMPVTIGIIAACCVVFAFTSVIEHNEEGTIAVASRTFEGALDHARTTRGVVVSREVADALSPFVADQLAGAVQTDRTTSCDAWEAQGAVDPVGDGPTDAELAAMNPNRARRLEAQRSARPPSLGAACEAQRAVEAAAIELDAALGRLPHIRWGYTPATPSLWQAITSTFMHGGAMHLIGNMWYLFLAGALVERSWGSRRFAVMYLLSGVFAVFAHQASAMGSPIPLVGASGAVSALLGAALVTHPNVEVRFGYFFLVHFRPYWGTFDARLMFAVGAWFVMQLVGVFMGGSGVAFWAHIGGFLLGAGFTWLFARWGWVQTEASDIEAEVAENVARLRSVAGAAERRVAGMHAPRPPSGGGAAVGGVGRPAGSGGSGGAGGSVGPGGAGGLQAGPPRPPRPGVGVR